METVQSYKLKIKGKQVIQLPEHAKFLSVTEGPTLNVLLDPEDELKERHIEIFASGAPMADESSLYNYIGSSNDLHIFEKVKQVEYELHLGNIGLNVFEEGGRTSRMPKGSYLSMQETERVIRSGEKSNKYYDIMEEIARDNFEEQANDSREENRGFTRKTAFKKMQEGRTIRHQSFNKYRSLLIVYGRIMTDQSNDLGRAEEKHFKFLYPTFAKNWHLVE